jgi:putative two-component system response regulator
MNATFSLPPARTEILIVDDTLANLNLLTKMLKEGGYKARPVPNGRLALLAAHNDPPDLILLDITMPEMDGYEVCQRLKADPQLREIPVIFISALSDVEEKVKAFQVGGLDYITKPFQFDEVKARIETHLKLSFLQKELQNQVQAQVKEISDSQMNMIFALARLAELRDGDTGKHIERVQAFCQLLTGALLEHPVYQTQIHKDFAQLMYLASPLHDIGKIGIPDAILQKPGKLTCQEFEVMKTHAVIGSETLKEVQTRFPGNQFIRIGIAISRSHHEKWDGSGYPDGMVGEAIPLAARIMALADVYDALRSRRVYKPPFSHEKSCEIILSDSGKQFDPGLCEVFARMQAEFAQVWQNLQDQ